MTKDIESPDFKNLFLDERSFVDVRAPVEFQLGHLPRAVNLPILNDEERALVGTMYKQTGQAAAVALGHQLISGEVRNSRVQAWITYLRQNPGAVVYCFRGGMRSQISRAWIREAGVEAPLIKGGYKAVRIFLRQQIEQIAGHRKALIVTGPTGSGKTQMLHELHAHRLVLDLENLAKHRGSAFGATKMPQPTQINFENELAACLLRLDNRAQPSDIFLIEDESRMIGRCALPEAVFLRLRESPVVWIEENLEKRVENIFQDYVKRTAIGEGKKEEAMQVFASYRRAVQAISKKLGGLRTQEILSLLATAELHFLESRSLQGHREWIEKLLVYYYDPLYLKSLERRQVKCLFRGSYSDCADFLRKYQS